MCRRARSLTGIVVPRIDQAELSERDIRRRALGSGTSGWPAEPDVRALAAAVLGQVTLPLPHALPSALEQNATLLAAVWRRGRKTAGHRSQAPFLDIGFDEDEAHLAEVHVDVARAVGADGREEVLGFQAVGDVFELFAVAREEDGSGAWTVADADHVALFVGGCVLCARERLVVAPLTCRGVRDRPLVQTYGL